MHVILASGIIKKFQKNAHSAEKPDIENQSTKCKKKIKVNKQIVEKKQQNGIQVNHAVNDYYFWIIQMSYTT